MIIILLKFKVSVSLVINTDRNDRCEYAKENKGLVQCPSDCHSVWRLSNGINIAYRLYNVWAVGMFIKYIHGAIQVKVKLKKYR